MSFVNSSDLFYHETPLPSSTPTSEFIKKSGYRYIPREIRAAIKRGETFYIGVELYAPSVDEIWATPNKASFCFSTSQFYFNNRLYRDKIQSIPELKRFIGKTFNSFSMKMTNVERGSQSGSRFVFKNVIRGFRVAVRIIFPDLSDVKMTRLIWWGRVASVQDLDENDVTINCSQEIGDFSYELAASNYGEACSLWFGKGECLGTETLEQKSLAFQTAYNKFGQGGCNRTNVRCIQLANERFYQGQRIITINGQFYRQEKQTKTFLFFFKRTKTVNVPVQYSSKNQSENDRLAIAWAFGRVRVELRPFTWADIGTQIDALMGACRGTIEGFYNVTCHNVNLAIGSITQHLGELGGVGTQQPDPRFPASGYNSKLAYAGVSVTGSLPEDEGEDVPTISAVLKAMLIPVRDKFGVFVTQWSCDPVWITRFVMQAFPYTTVKSQWFNDDKNQETVDYCRTVVEDDTESEIPVITGGAFNDYQAGNFARFRSVNRFTSANLQAQATAPSLQNVMTDLKGQSVPSLDDTEVMQLIRPPIDEPPDVIFGDGLGSVPILTPRTYLMQRYTTNLLINQKSKLSDLLFGLILPTFQGYLRFNQFGQIEIDCRKPADNSFIRAETPVASTEIPVASCAKFSDSYGWLLIGVGIASSEIARIKGIRFVNGNALTDVTLTASIGLGAIVSPHFIDRDSAPSEIYIDFSGSPTAGEKIELKFVEPDGTIYTWDYFVESSDNTLDMVAQMFAIRLNASPVFRETWTAEVFDGHPNRVIVRCQTGYIILDRPTLNVHYIGEEILRGVEVYEDGKDPENPNGIKDNMNEFKLNDKPDSYHGVKATYISAVQDFRETELLPRVAWDAAEQERNLNLLELDLRGVDNYRQAAFLTKSAAIKFIDGNLPANFKTGIMGMFHDEGEVIIVRHQTMEGLSYVPFTVEDLSYSEDTQMTTLSVKLYLSAAFDERVAKEEKFLETTLTTNTEPNGTPPASLTDGGYSTTGTGDGAGGTRQALKYETQPYEVLPEQQRYSPHGRDHL